MKSQLITPEYLAQLKEKHHGKGWPKWGNTGYKFAQDVRLLAKQIGAGTILDYGCGSGTLSKSPILIRFKMSEYDPGVDGKRDPPVPADLVVCTDVLEHIEPCCIDAVLDHIFSLTIKACFASICMREAENWLPDGRNAHLIIEPIEWWMERLNKYGWSITIKSVDAEDCVLIARR